MLNPFIILRTSGIGISVILCALMFVSTTHAYFDLKGAPSASSIDGIRFENYKGFEKKWNLVTVRFRKDTGELRFVYANDLAFKELNRLQPHYPDGAVFAKIGFSIEEDPSFLSSAMPGKVARYQLMVRNQKQYSTSDGWGYALFNGEGRPFDGAAAMNKEACVACHRIVPERNFIFSRPFQTASQSQLTSATQKSGFLMASLFEQKKKTDLPKPLQNRLSHDIQTVEYLKGNLRETAFAGTLDETIPLLTERAKQTGRAAVLVMNDNSFSLVTLVSAVEENCQTKDLKSVKVLVQLNGKLVRNAAYCH